MKTFSYVDQNLAEIRACIDAARERSGGRDVTLLAVVKYTDTEHINYLHSLGVNDIGENRVQQLLEHWEALERNNLRVHFIGTLQKNKVKYIIDKVSMIHSLDSLSLAQEIEKQAAKHGLVMDVLVEINSGMEENKSGISPEEAAAFCEALGQFSHIKLRGFMTMAPNVKKMKNIANIFAKLLNYVLTFGKKHFII